MKEIIIDLYFKMEVKLTIQNYWTYIRDEHSQVMWESHLKSAGYGAVGNYNKYKGYGAGGDYNQSAPVVELMEIITRLRRLWSWW